MQTEDLHVFVMTCRLGTLSAAARALGINQSSASRAIMRLEADVGAQLIERSRPAISPTRAGLGLLSYADDVLTGIERLRARIATADGRSNLQIGSSTVPSETLVPSLIAEFRQRHDDVDVNLHVMDSASVLNCALYGHCDVGFSGMEAADPDVTSVRIEEDEIVLIAPLAHRLAGRVRVGLQELKGEAFVQRGEGSGTASAVRQALKAHGLTLPAHHSVLEVDSSHALIRAVSAGIGLGFVSTQVLHPDVAAGVVVLRLAEIELRRSIRMIYVASRLSPAAADFVAMVRDLQVP